MLPIEYEVHATGIFELIIPRLVALFRKAVEARRWSLARRTEPLGSPWPLLVLLSAFWFAIKWETVFCHMPLLTSWCPVQVPGANWQCLWLFWNCEPKINTPIPRYFSHLFWSWQYSNYLIEPGNWGMWKELVLFLVIEEEASIICIQI